MDNEEKLAEFISVTGADRDRAKFFLESSGWNVELAMGSFYEDDEPEILSPDDDTAERAPTASSAATTRSSRETGVHTLRSMVEISSDSDEDGEKGQAFYAGGSVHSGQQVLGPPRSRKNGEEIVKEMFKAAREHGAEEVHRGTEPATAGQRITFSGTGYRLGETGSDVTVVPDPAAARQQPPARHVHLRLWRTGFSVDDGPLREFADPENQQFLNDIRSGHIPRELVHQARGAEVHLDMEDHRTEDYVKPKSQLKSFSGTGHTLGRPTPALSGCASSVKQEATAADPALCEAEAAEKLAVDPTSPVTSVQVRLDDGSRLLVKLNASHTIADLRRYIVTARPRYSGGNLRLRTAFPSRELSDDSVSLKEAQLLNAAVIARIE